MKESSIEKKDHELQSKEIFEKEIASLKDKIDSIQDLSDTSRSANKEQLKEESIPIVKNQSLSFTSYAKPLFDFLTAKIIEAYHVSKKTLISLLVKFLRSTIPFVQDFIGRRNH
ncbi:hypothetical protein JHK82_034282 [Glycine max]|nr:hypothetical protein JHK85_034993 [Glycine max]KAG4986660.1 hypothetical protein JHK86_034351 [Glycine max]KAG5119862.1 hypothetical protein JHK82_034282 [Glycine max]KAG5140852.1 hypothetical protein JHK84_034620 [Glycine max]